MSSPIPIEVSNGNLVIDGNVHFHIKSVEVYTGPDDYLQTDCRQITVEEKNLVVKKPSFSLPKPVPHRPRNEPSVRFFLESETTGQIIKLSVCFHKGNIEMFANIHRDAEIDFDTVLIPEEKKAKISN